MTACEWRFGERCVNRFCCDPSAPVLYVHASAAEAERLAQSGWTIVSIDGNDWNRDLTPWPARSVFRGRPDFAGGAGEYLQLLKEEIIPEVETDLQPALRGVMGYSLAGLFAAYAALESDCFDFFACVSGSMWYPGFVEYAARKKKNMRCAYFSVGDREKAGRNAAFHSIEKCTQNVCDLLAEAGAATVFELNPGGHFENVPERMRRAVEWLSKEIDRKNGGKTNEENQTWQLS